MTSSEMTPADIAAVTGNHNSGWGFGDNSFWIIILFLFVMCGWGNNGWNNGGGGVQENYVLASDFSQVERKLDGVYSGICDSTFALNNTINNGFAAAQQTMVQGFSGLNTGMVQQGYETRLGIQGIGSQMQQCCCDIREGIANVNYNMASQACDTRNLIQYSTRDIVDSQNANTRAILDALNKQTLEQKNEKIAELQTQVQNLNLAASQARQNTYLIDQLKAPCAVPAYVVPNPNAVYNTCGCNGS